MYHVLVTEDVEKGCPYPNQMPKAHSKFLCFIAILNFGLQPPHLAPHTVIVCTWDIWMLVFSVELASPKYH